MSKGTVLPNVTYKESSINQVKMHGRLIGE